MNPSNGEIWQTKTGNSVLIVIRPTEVGSELGFIWFDPIDGLLSYSAALDRLSYKSHLNIKDWSLLMEQLQVVKASACNFILAWRGPCNKKNCTKHKDLKCCSCGEPATHECDETGYGCVCGELLCANCEHSIGEDGTNSGKLPEGMKRHCKKSEQVYLPWYMREENESKG